MKKILLSNSFIKKLFEIKIINNSIKYAKILVYLYNIFDHSPRIFSLIKVYLNSYINIQKYKMS